MNAEVKRALEEDASGCGYASSLPLVHRLHTVSMTACKCDDLEHRLTQPPYLHYRHLNRTFELGGAFGLCTAYTLCGDYRYTVLTKTILPN